MPLCAGRHVENHRCDPNWFRGTGTPGIKPPTTTNQSPRDQLTCELVSAISVTPEPNGEGFDTPEQAVESYADWATDLPQGT